MLHLQHPLLWLPLQPVVSSPMLPMQLLNYSRLPLQPMLKVLLLPCSSKRPSCCPAAVNYQPLLPLQL